MSTAEERELRARYKGWEILTIEQLAQIDDQCEAMRAAGKDPDDKAGGYFARSKTKRASVSYREYLLLGAAGALVLERS